MKRQTVCPNCHQPFFTTIKIVYVFKRHFCPNDKEVLNFDGKNIFSCLKCKKVFHKNNLLEYGSMGTGIMGTARTWETVQERMADGKTDYDKIEVPTEPYCQKCKNFATRRLQLEKCQEQKENSGKAEMKVIPKEIKDTDIYRYEINRKIQEDFKAENQRLQQEQRKKNQEEQQKKGEAFAKAKIVEGMTKELSKEIEKEKKTSK